MIQFEYFFEFCKNRNIIKSFENKWFQDLILKMFHELAKKI